jgi:hypothetical protein
MDRGRALLDPQRDDLLVAEGVVEVHVRREEVLHVPAVLRALGLALCLGHGLLEAGDAGVKSGVDGLAAHCGPL